MSDEAKRPWEYGLTVAALSLAIVVLGSIHFWRRFERRGESMETPEEAAASAPASEGQAEIAPEQPAGVPSIDRPSPGTRPQAGAPDEPPGGSRDEAGGPARGADHDSQAPPTRVPDGSASQAPASRSGVDSTGAVAGQAAQPNRPVDPRQGAVTPVAPPGAPGHGPAVPAVHEPAVAPPSGEDRPPKEENPGGGPASDRTPPVLGTIRFDPGVVEGGGVTTLTIQATDNISGVKSLRGEIQSPSGKALLPLYLQEVQGGTSFTYVLNIPPAAETGIWFVKWLYLTDVADNSALTQVASASTAPPGGTFSVSSSESDSIPPDVVEISFEKDTIEDEDRNVIRVEVTDDLSGVASVSGACQSPSRSALIPFTCALDEATGLWMGEVVIPEHGDCGVWSVQQLAARDKAGNTTHLTADSRPLAHADFKVAPRADCDSSPPTLDAFALSQTIVPGDSASEIRITASVHDVGTGAATVGGWFEGPVSEGGLVPRKDFTCVPDPEHPDAPWTGTIQVPQFTARGIWKVRVIRLEDRARNFREYTTADPVLSGGAFEVR